MTLAQKIENILKDELKPEDIKTVIDLAEFLEFKELQKRWDEIDESEYEYVTEEEKAHFEELIDSGEFINQEVLLKELGINEDEILN